MDPLPAAGGMEPIDFANAALAGAPAPDMEAEYRKAEDAANAADDRRALVNQIIDRIRERKDFFKTSFTKMKSDARFVANVDNAQWKDAMGNVNADAYVANITHRFIQSKVAALYAKNPRVKAKRKERVDFQYWDGRPETLQSAITTLVAMQGAMQMASAAGIQPSMPPPGMGGGMATPQAGPPPGAPPPGPPGAPPMGHNGGPPMAPPQMAAATMIDPTTALLIVREAVQARERRDMLDKIGKTAEILFHYFIDSARPRFKSQMKQATRRAATVGVAWVQLDFEREYDGHRPETETKIRDARDGIDKLKANLHGIETNDITAGDPRIAESQLQLNTLVNEPDLLVREGLVFDFPRSWDMIPDKECRQLIGYVGGRRLAREFHYTPEQIKSRFKLDIGSKFSAYQRTDSNAEGGSFRPRPKGDKGGDDLVCWWEEYDSTTGLVYCVADGYDDFLCEPSSPRIKVEQFFPFYALALNEVENDDALFPPSDVDFIRHQQMELNRSREARRQHRIAAQPYWVAGKDKLADGDIKVLKRRSAHDVILLDAMIGTQKVTDVFAPGPTAPLDPNLYDDSTILKDLMLSGGAQEANLGPVSGGTATEAGIAEASRSATISSNVDDQDDMLSDLARDAMAVMLREISLETARKIAGPGALWPETTGEDVAAEMILDIVAGSSGKRNRERDAATFERIAPLAIQLPNINPTFLARLAVELMDAQIDIDDAILDGIPSVIAQNAMLKGGPGLGGMLGGPGATPTGDPSTDPGAQGGMGADNAPQGPGVPGGPMSAPPGPSDAMNTQMGG